MNGFFLKAGVVTHWAWGVEDNRASLLAAAKARVRNKSLPKHHRAIAAAQVKALSAPLDLGTFVPCDPSDWPEIVIGSAPAWPRALRFRVMTQSDHVDYPSWRATKEAAQLAEADRARAHLRDLPALMSDPVEAFCFLRARTA